MLEKETLIHCWWECKLVQPLWKTVWRLLKKTKKRFTIWSSNFTPRDIPEGMWVTTIKTPAHLCLLQQFSQYPSYGNSQGAPQLMNELRKCGIYIQWNFIQSQRRMKFCHLQVNGWNWTTSYYVKLFRFRKPRPHVFSHVEYKRENNTNDIIYT
jgi:hypothetical protein